jgi:hypothetical protein
LARERVPLPTTDQGRGVDADSAYVYLVACADCDGPAPRSHLDIGQYRSVRDSLGAPPLVTITSPSEGDVLAAGSSSEIRADASDDVGVLAVELLIDGEVAGRDERAPFGVTFTVPENVNRLVLGARAYDFAANRGDAPNVEVGVGRTGVTTLRGVVVDPDDEPVGGAIVIAGAVNGGGGAMATTTGSDGGFVLAEVPAGGAIVARASTALAGRKHNGSSAPLAPIAGGVTDAGVIRLEPVGVLYPGPRSLTGSTALAMARGDFDGDGVEDLAVIHSLAAEGLAILGGLGDGRFRPRQRLALAGSFVTAGDLTLDGAPDLVIGGGGSGGGASGSVTALRNAGDGTFAATQSRAVGVSPRAARIGDFDGDALPDVIVANNGSGDLSLLRGDGDAELGPAARFALAGSPEDLAATDFDLDGRLDLAVAVSGPAPPHSVEILLGGGGGLATAGALTFSIAALGLAAGDLDADGLSDLAIGAGRANDSQKALVALGHGDGTLALTSPLGTSLLGSPLSMALDDLDGDGALDLAVARERSPCNDIRLLRGDGAGQLTTGVLPTITDSCSLRGVVTTDQNGDGLPEIVSLDSTGVTGYSSAGAGDYERRRELLATSKPVQLAVVDLDSDGRLDLVHRLDVGKGLGVALGNGDGTFRATAGVTTSVFLQQVAAGDVNRDGIADLVVSSLDEIGALLGAGDGTFAPPILLPIERSLSSVVVVDVSGDGGGDVVATNGLLDELLVFESGVDGALELAGASMVGDAPRATALGDFDRDGALDAAVVNFGSDDVSILLGSGGGGFAPQVRYGAREQPRSIAAADLDLDGAVDLVVAGSTRSLPPLPLLTVLSGDGSGGFGAPVAVPASTMAAGVAAADVDLDGLADLVLPHPTTHDLSILLGVGDGTFFAADRTRTGGTPTWLEIADVDSDGRLDLLTANRGDNGGGGISLLLHR